MPKITVDWNTLYNFVTDAFVAVGVPRNDAVICADVLLESDKRGIESHGVNRFKPIYIDRILDGIQKPVTEFEILRETPTTAVVDGHDGMGQVVGYKSMSMAIEKAKKYGMGMVAARNSCHYGIAGYYATMADEGEHDRHHGYQRASVHRADLRRGEHARNQPADRRYAHRRGLPVRHRLRDEHHTARQAGILRAHRQVYPRGDGHRA